QVKSQVKAQVTRILPRIDESVNAYLEAEVLTRSSHSSRTSYAVVADLLEMELKKILIDKMEGNKSIQRSDEQRNLYKALVEAYDADKTILDPYRESAILKRRREEDDDQEGPSVGLDRGSTTWTQSRQMSASESAFAEEPVQTTCQMEEPSYPVFETVMDKCTSKETDARSSFNELLDTPIDFSNFIMNQLGVDTLTPELLAGLTYELIRGSCNSLTELEYHLEEVYKAMTDQLDWDNPEDKTILDSYGESAILKRIREDADDQEGPSTGSDRGPKRQREGGEHASASTLSEPAIGSASMSTTGSQSRQLYASESVFAEEPVHTTCQMEEPSHLVFETGAKDPPIVQTSQHPEWFSQPRKPPTPDHDWNKSLPAAQGNAQSWISALAKQTDARSSFNKLQDTPIDFSNFIMNWLGIDTLTPELLAGPTYELMKGLCNSLTELEYHLEEVYKAMTDQLDWVNPEGQQYPHNLLQPLPLIPDNRGRRVIPFEHFINNDLEYLR
nr:hypothetical protein [Tanacetum cinerariifolium]